MKKGNPLALLPIGVFLAIYLGLGLLFEYGLHIPMGFYNVPIIIAFLAAILVACLQNRALSFDDKLAVMGQGVGDKNIMTMILIFLVAGVFVGVTGRDSAEAVAYFLLSIAPAWAAVAVLFVAACFVSTAMGTSVGTITLIVPIAVAVYKVSGFSLPLCIGSVMGGAMFGDNLSFISDTTIAACNGQGCAMKDKFRGNFGIALPAAPGAETLAVASQLTVNIFCLIVFGACVVVALLLGCKPKNYLALLKSENHVANISGTLGKEVFLMNVGIYGLFILAYYNLIGASFNGVTFGIIFCMLCTCNSGSHPGNVWPIMLGYVVGSLVFGWLSQLAGGTYGMAINAQAIVIGLCFANGLSPIVSKYGWFWGAVSALMVFVLVTSVPNMHGGFCLYNGGFTAAVICVILVPVLEKFVKTKAEKKAAKV